MPKKPESLFAKRVLDDLHTLGGWYYKVQDVSRVGIPDILGCLHGCFYALELKVGNNKPSPLQTYNLDEIMRAKGFAAVVYPSNWDEVKETLVLYVRRHSKVLHSRA